MKERKSFILRIDQATYTLLEKWASDEFRSVNGQIEYLLQQALVQSGRKKTKDTGNASGPVKKE
ncbi:hypothetical protein A8C56_08765 [Niabella ginsenosidivorans]|uniref:Arc family DNA binding domain-containing protein n=1 Tax=Niabella ginsenosidivorans TaxID=1176587 RepID=A0A1A9I086_9BACT|nr:Arc family DNA binding domain-containing protein [Niabella ginsenosidivorans]ANH81058.1 hypothetical protein A8C56_08765 [Niabella ginsenosidivorans]